MLLWDVLARSSAVLVIAALVNVALRGRSASLRHAVWAFGLFGALAIAPLSWVLPSWHVPLVPTWATEASAVTPAPVAQPTPMDVPAVMPRASIDVAAPPVAAVPPEPTAARQSASAAPQAPGLAQTAWRELRRSWPLALAGLWALGTLILFGRLAAANLATARALHTRSSEPAPWIATAHELAYATGVPRTRFVRSETITMPMAAGYLRPTVVLPAEADAWPDERITSVLLHELAHVRRRDCLTQLAASAACALYWMNPLAWYAAKALRQERERACDDAVLAAGTAGPDYAEHLLDVARAARHVTTPTFSGGVAMAYRSELEGRLMAILDDARNRQSISYGAAGIAGLLCLALVTPLAALDPFALSAAAAQPVAIPPGAGPAPKAPKAPRPVMPQPATAAPVAAAPQAAALAPMPPMPPMAPVAIPLDALDAEIAVQAHTAVRTAVSHNIRVNVDNEFNDDQSLPTPAPTPTPSPSPTPTPSPAAAPRQGVPGGVAGGVGGAVAPGRAERVRREATPADPRVIAALGGALKDTDAEVRQQAAHSLGQMRDPAAAAVLIPALQDADVEVRQNVVFALGQLRDERAIPGLAIALKDQNDEVRERAAFALSQFRDPKVVEPLLVAARDTNSDVRKQALFAISQIDASKGKDAAIEALKDKDPEVRRMAVHLLGRLGRD